MRFFVGSIAVLLALGLASANPSSAAEPTPEREAPHRRPDSARLEQIQIQRDVETRDAHFRWDWIEERFAPWENYKNRLVDEWGLDFFVAYSNQFQAGSQEQSRTFIGDRWELLGEWKLLESDSVGDGKLAFWFLRTMTLGDNRSNEYQAAMGSAWPLNDLDTGSNDERNEIGFLWWEQNLPGDWGLVAVGKLDPNSFIAVNRYLFDDRILFNLGTLAIDPVFTLHDDAALGAYGEFRVGPAYLSGLWVDGDARNKSIDFDSIDNGRYSYALEFGFETEIEGLGEGNYRGSWYRADSKGRGGPESKSAMGGAISIDQDLGDDFALFFYWSRRVGRRAPLRQNLSTGLVLRQPFGFSHDLVGLGFSWGEPDGGQGKDDQFGFEALYRLQLTNRLELTPLLQWIIKPADSGTDTRLSGGLRLRLVL